MDHKEIKSLISIMGFKPAEGKENIYSKSYSNHNNYNLCVDFANGSIEYGDKITLGDKTTSNFSSSENFVVLECVDKLLTKGYAPEKLTLEIKWPLGHKEKGKLDIYVADKDDDNKCFLMIECKTFGSEYEKEKKNMLLKGGQLFSYFQQDKSAQYLCLYASKENAGVIEYDNSIVEITEELRLASNQSERHSMWNKSFKDNGVFESFTTVYDIKSKALIRDKLKPMQQADSGFIFNIFAEILRHNVVSDKSNAFNKIFNLFLCKIADENKNPDEELDFQWREDDTDVTLQNRLNNLYKEGMRKFLSIDVADFSNIDLEKELETVNDASKKHIKDMFTKLRFYKNNEFSFKEVFDENSFNENAIVVRSVVELLQPYQLRYSHKQQFLGDFFELLLNTGLKQESGQFFTPVPIAKFITSSIPLKEIVEQKIKSGETHFLPYVIDYAAGSGHFLTEAMDEIQKIINELSHKSFKDSVKNKLTSYSVDSYNWAEEFIYGIEKDYRLVKTAKVACFLNGDGLANLIHADGLDSFENSADYVKLLRRATDTNKQNNHQFDVIVANPPYSVSAFKNTLKDGKNSFDLHNRFTDDSSEIECLFIERTKQLLKEGGYAGIVLPSSILSNSGVYVDAREIILKYFEVVGIAEFGTNTFMATNTNTVTLFLKKRDENQWLRLQGHIDEFMKKFTDVTCNGIEKAFSTYSECIYNIDFEQYVILLNAGFDKDISTEALQILVDYNSAYVKSTGYKNLISPKLFKTLKEEEQKELILQGLGDFVKIKEKEKLLYFLLSYGQQVVLIKSGEKQAEKDFLGYDFSNRRGKEGMTMYLDASGKPTTKLYDTDDLLNSEKVNSYIHKAFLGQTIEEDIPDSLSEHIFIKELSQMINFESSDFSGTKTISLVDKKPKIETQWDVLKLGDIVETINGLWEGKKPPFVKINVIRNTNFDKNGTLNLDNVVELDVEQNQFSKRTLQYGDIILEKSGGSNTQAVGRVVFFDLKEENFSFSNFTTRMRLITDKVDHKYLFLFLNYLYDLGHTLPLQNGASGIKNLNMNSYLSIKIPIPPMDSQQKMVKELEDFYANVQIKNIGDPKAFEKELSKVKKQANAIIEQYL